MQLNAHQLEQIHLTVLKDLYLNNWPDDNDQLKDYLEFVAEQGFQTVIFDFHTFLQDRNVSHPAKYKRTDIMVDAYYVAETKEYKNLLAFVSKIKLSKNNLHFFNNNDQNFTVTTLQSIKKLSRYIVHHPIKSLTTILALQSTTTTVGATLSVENDHGIDKNEDFLYKNKVTATTEYQGVKVGKLTLNDCEKNNDGGSESSEGRICRFPDGKKYYLKKLPDSTKQPNVLDRHQFQYVNDIFKGYYNQKMMKNVLEDVTIPDNFIVCDENKPQNFFVASEKVDGFKQAVVDCKEMRYQFNCIYFREALVNRIGEEGIARLAIANMFIKDLHAKNWGFDQNNDLTIVDFDQSPSSYEDHIKYIIKKFKPSTTVYWNLGFELSLENLVEIKRICQTMLDKNLPVINNKINMPQAVYVRLLSTIIKACDHALLALQNNAAIKPYAPGAEIAESFSQALKNLYLADKEANKVSLSVNEESQKHGMG